MTLEKTRIKLSLDNKISVLTVITENNREINLPSGNISKEMINNFLGCVLKNSSGAISWSHWHVEEKRWIFVNISNYEIFETPESNKNKFLVIIDREEFVLSGEDKFKFIDALSNYGNLLFEKQFSKLLTK